MPAHIHLFGAPGSGVSTLGKALAAALDRPYFDVDDFYWFTSDPLPYKRKRNPDHRRALLSDALNAHTEWVLGGALCGWGDVFIPQFDWVLYCQLPTSQRLSRIAARETARYGPEPIAEGGALHGVFEKFCRWAANYEHDASNIRSMDRELAWLQALACPTQIIHTDKPVGELTHDVLTLMARIASDP